MRKAERRTGSNRRSTRLRKQRSVVDATERTEKMTGNERIRRTEVTPPRAEPYEEDEIEVAVVGAGPVGLTAAAMLAAYSRKIRVNPKVLRAGGFASVKERLRVV